MLIIDATPEGLGWFPINHMVALASQLFEADVEVLSAERRPPWRNRVGSVLRQRGFSGYNDEMCLLIGASPADLLQIVEIDGRRKRFRLMAA